MCDSIPTICLNMIVKDEAHIIIKTFNNILSYIPISYWVICDTGSTDNTKEIITEFFKCKNIPGELIDEKWTDFAYNRTKALEYAFKKTDFLLIFDADDSIHNNFCLPQKFESDMYLFKFGPDYIYTRPLLLNNNKKWRYKGVVHEFLVGFDYVTEEIIDGDYYIQSGREGGRSKNPNKYINDALILKNAFFEEEKKDFGLAARYAFYCAQSYKDAGPQFINETIEWYLKCLTLKMWKQEQFISSYQLGELFKEKNDYLSAVKYWCKTIEFDPDRIEGIVTAMEYLRTSDQHLLVNTLYHKFKHYKKHDRKLFLNISAYNNFIEYNNSISAFYINDLMSGFECCKIIFKNKLLPYHLLKQTISNFQFYLNGCFEQKDEYNLELFYDFDRIINMIGKKNEEVNSTMIDIWNFLFNKCKNLITKPNLYMFTNKTENISIMISFTTCKRLHLFKDAVYSLINQWTDINLVDYWFCVDDNSSELDRLVMKESFPWIEFYMKSIQEKGHLKSMNIIWNKLNQLKPKYWIHMEDDFIFFKKGNYIHDSINGLNSLQKYGKIKQILFNRNYGEGITCYNILGHENINDNNFVIHQYNEKINPPYRNCHFWPHYSLLPSIIEVDSILQIGNYDSNITFFEKDYALKWEKLGFKTAFFNDMSCQHTGKLRCERNDKTKKNAYELNDSPQF